MANIHVKYTKSSKRKTRIPNKFENTVCDLNKKKVVEAEAECSVARVLLEKEGKIGVEDEAKKVIGEEESVVVQVIDTEGNETCKSR